MMILSSASVSSRFVPVAVSSSSASPSLSFPSSASLSMPFCALKWRRCPCLVHSAKVRGVAETVEMKPDESSSSSSSCADTSGSGAEAESKHSKTFLNVRSEEELLSELRKEKESGRLPLNIASGLEELYRNYREAVLSSGNPTADDVILSNMKALFDRILLDVEEPYTFGPYHRAIRQPYDYYMFGQNYIRPLVDLRTSYVGNVNIFYEMEKKLQQGDNIILISNHQSEADPAVIALLLEKSIPRLAEDMTYIAGDRVVTDPLCKPFSMGRNLLCVYSKKHMNDDPELVEMKRKANTRSLKEMAMLLREGSQIIWIAPSGGRDRPDAQTGEWFPAPFDASAVDNMRRLANHSGVPGHLYPLALLCYDIMPPPLQVEKEIGEKRVLCFHGTGLSAGPEISYSAIGARCEHSEQAKEAYSQALYDSVFEQYNVLKSAIHGQQGVEASTPSVHLSQPWTS
uniref:Glycerol-3-phosphate acyltransferase, chloroplastic n=1 Tax=Kalanchoe fedtschenkoi TaxID=63787 RepID=A0A7N1A1G5_KALFE